MMKLYLLPHLSVWHLTPQIFQALIGDLHYDAHQRPNYCKTQFLFSYLFFLIRFPKQKDAREAQARLIFRLGLYLINLKGKI